MLVGQVVLQRIARDRTLDGLIYQRDHAIVDCDAHRADPAGRPPCYIFDKRACRQTADQDLLAPARDRVEDIGHALIASHAGRDRESLSRALLQDSLVMSAEPG